MDVNVNVKENRQIRAFYLFFIIISIQIGVGIMGAPMYIFTEARQDSWISILIALGYILVVLFVMLQILKQYESADIFGIHVDIFGKWVGKTLGTIYIIHFAVALFTVMVTYIEVIKIFIFPELSSIIIGFLLLSLLIYSILGGLRVVVGVVFAMFFLNHWLLFLLYEPALRIDFTHFQPLLNASFIELLNGAKATSFTFMGFEILFLLYPFVQNKKAASFPVYFGASWSAGIILINTVVAIGYFSPQQLEHLEWSVLSLYKIVTFPFVERFDYIVVAVWMMVVLATMVLLLWGVTYGVKRLYKLPQRTTLYLTSFILLISCGFLSYHTQVIALTDMFARIGFWIAYVYPFILLPIVLLKKRFRKKKKGSEGK